ncbi:MAG TPA: cytidine deaminase [Planctomycetota bacterium]|jgi:cytidine deaminase|nr:cytidine deaminase [Planctomycetota bacterium]
MDDRNLLAVAEQAAAVAYAPYSGAKVGATLLATDGRFFVGCNVENASFGLTICAERAAVFKAVGEGARRFRRMAIYVYAERLFPPCGACRQVLQEFAPEVTLIASCASGETREWRLADLLPHPFTSPSVGPVRRG